MVTLVVIYSLLAEKSIIDGYKNLIRDMYMVHNKTSAIGTNKNETLKKHH